MSNSRSRVQRSPTVLVTDSREQQAPPTRRAPSTRFITVDNVLQYASDVPSMQQRHPPNTRARPRSRLASAAGGLMGSAGNAAGSSSRLAAQPRLPPRSTKLSEKLVLIPETAGEEGEAETQRHRGHEYDEGDEEEGDEYEEEVDEEVVERLARAKNWDRDYIRHQLLAQKKKTTGDFDVDNDLAPLLAEEEISRRRKTAPDRAKSYAERLPKARRAEKMARVTAYCTAQAYKMSSLATFVKEQHGGRTKLYDDCLYTAYHLPLLPGHDGYRLRSSPEVKKPGGKSLLDEEIERNELRDHHDYMEAEEHSVGHHHGREGVSESTSNARDEHQHEHQHQHQEQEQEQEHQHMDHGGDQTETAARSNGPDISNSNDNNNNHHAIVDRVKAPTAATLPYDVAEMFVFSYGVVVFWNLTERQEKDLLADLAFATSSVTGSPIPLATMPLQEEDFESEEFHFEYSTEISRPRVYNDMITLRSGDHMIKLTISHGIAQSTKLCFFEEVMARQMSEAKDIPRRLAVTGQLGMKREEVFRILGRLFKSRVEVNLSSNMLDVPNFFWESEPTLCPLYIAVREYLEIKPRIQVLNERCRVFLDLAEILSDSIADSRTSHQTWIIIVLIIISIVVTTSEVFLRFGMISASSSSSATNPAALLTRALGTSSAASTEMCSCPCPVSVPVPGIDAGMNTTW